MEVVTIEKRTFSYVCERFIEFAKHYCPVKILDLEINRVDHHPLGR